jgi:hypothetical protein
MQKKERKKDTFVSKNAFGLCERKQVAIWIIEKPGLPMTSVLGRLLNKLGFGE